MLTKKGDISNYLRVNININSDSTLKLSQSHLRDKIFNHVRRMVFVSLKGKETPEGKLLLHNYESSPARNFVWNYREAVDMLSYNQGSTEPEISMESHQCVRFCNNEHTGRPIAEYLPNTLTSVDLLYGK